VPDEDDPVPVVTRPSNSSKPKAAQPVPEPATAPTPEPRTSRTRRAPVRPDERDPRHAKVVEDIRTGEARAKANRKANKASFVDIYAATRDESKPIEDIFGMIRDTDDDELNHVELFGEMLDDDLIDFAASLKLEDETTMTLKQALSGPEREKWREALIEEFAAIQKMGVYHLVRRRDVPAGRRILKGKAVFKRKRNEAGDIIRWKARWVVKGFLQVFGEDYSKTTSPTARLESFRVLCHIAAAEDLEIRQFDVKTAFLHGELDEDEHIFMEQPPGFEEPGTERDYVWELLRGLYGMKQAGRVWNIKFNDVLVNKLMFHRVSAEHCLYVRRSETGFAIASVHVDDTLAVASSNEELDLLEQDLRSEFDISVADGSFILGIHLQRDREKRLIHLSQTALIDKVVRRFGQENARAISTPMEHGAVVTRKDSPKSEEDKAKVDVRKFGELIGSLQYLAQGTRPDIAYATSRLASVLNDPGEKHYNMGLRVVRYLNTTRTYGITLGGDSPVALSGMSDSDFANCIDTRRSVSGYAYTLGHGAVSWSSRKQDIVTTSTTEAEYVAMCNATKEAVWLRSLLDEIGYGQPKSTLICADNQSSIVLSEDQANHTRTKHIDLRYHFVRERTLLGEVHFRYVKSCDNVADVFTKALPYPAFSLLRKRLGVQAFVER
jgi:hypothetical protein